MMRTRRVSRSCFRCAIALLAFLLVPGCEKQSVRFGEDETEREVRTPIRSGSREEAREKEERGQSPDVQGSWR